MTEIEKRSHRVCFTGHRPEKLKRSEKDIRKELNMQIERAISDGFNVFITGMARGVDIWAAQIVLEYRDKGHNIKLICACPYEGFETSWSHSWQKQYTDILKRADLVKYISGEYNYSCFQTRNEWMVNHSARVIAVYDGSPGGTRNTIAYSQKNGVPIVIVNG